MTDFETGAVVPGESPEQIKARIAKLEASYASKKAEVDKLNAWLSDCEEKINALKATMPDDNVQQSLEASLSKQSEPEEEQSNDYPDPGDVGGLIYNSTAKKRNALMRDWLEHNFRDDGFSLPKSLFNRIHDSVNNLTGVNKDPEDEAAFINALNKEFKNDFVNDEDDHFGEEQAEGLDNLLEGLKDTPHDNRW